jgi:hypothetical protein
MPRSRVRKSQAHWIATLLGLRPDSLYMLIARAKAQFEKKYLRLYGRTQ